MKFRLPCCFLFCLSICLTGSAVEAKDKDAKKTQAVHAVAVFPFQERGRDVEGLGSKASDLLFAELVANPELYLVEREDLKKVLSEQELNLSGIIKPAEAIQIGQWTGAKIIVTGSVLQVGDKLYLVAKIIGTETTRVLGASVKGQLEEELSELAEDLAEAVAKTITERAAELIAKPIKKEDRIAALRKQMKNGKRPTVFVEITERHVGQATIDPAALTELTFFCRELGFQVIDPQEGNKNQADILLLGEGLSEFGSRHGNLMSVKARLELKAVDRKSGRVLAVDRQTSLGVGLVEQIAAKEALQEAAAELAVRLLPKILSPQKKAKPEK